MGENLNKKDNTYSTIVDLSGKTKNRYNLYNELPKANKAIVDEWLLVIDDNTSIKCSSKFGPLWEAQPNNLMSLLSSSFGMPSGQFALQGAQIWKSTDPLSMSFSGVRYMDTDPYDDVIEPVEYLMCRCLPRLSNEFDKITFGLEQIADSLLGIKLMTLIPPGPNIQSLLKEFASSDESGEYKGFMKLIANRADIGAQAKGVVNVNIGNLTFGGCVITNVTPTFSKAVAYSKSKQNYYPISATVNIEFITIQVANTGYVCGIA